MSTMKNSLLKAVTGLTICASLALGSFAAKADGNIAGKKVIFVPIAMGITLTEAWAKRMKEHAAIYGYNVDVRDAAFNSGAMSELLAKAISEKPDVLVVHNPTVQLLARQIKQAESQGIKVLQLNLTVEPAFDRIRGRELGTDRTRNRRRHRQGVRRR